jgi:hypothetical protein
VPWPAFKRKGVWVAVLNSEGRRERSWVERLGEEQAMAVEAEYGGAGQRGYGE